MDIMSSIPGLGSFASMDWKLIGTWTLVILFFMGLLFVGFIVLMQRKTRVPIYEIDLVSHRLKQYNCRPRKDVDTKTIKLYIGKYKKSINQFQQEDIYYKGNRDIAFMVKDNNGMLHSLRILNKQDLIDFYQKIKGVDITKEKIIGEQGQELPNPYYNLYSIYCMPNPNEDLEWLGKECQEANKEFRFETEWWKHPNVMILGCAFICLIMFIATVVLTK